MPQEERKQEQGGGGARGWAAGATPLELAEFKGMNNQSPRQSIDDNECWYLENFFPIGPGNTRCMYDKGTSIYTATGGHTVVSMFFYNVATANYCCAFLSDGTATQINVSSGATAVITASANTFYQAGYSLPQAVQWGNNGILIVSSTASNGYYAWDGTTLYSPGGASPSWLSGLTSNIVTTGTTHTSTTIDAIPTTTSLQAGMLVTGSGVPTATFIASITSSTAIVITNATSSSLVGTALTFSWAMPTGLKGTAIEVFQNRVWVANGTTVSFSAPANGAYFGTALGGGSFTSSDSFLRNAYIGLRQSNGYLYVFGDSSINYVGNVQTTVSGSTITTTFNNLNTDPQVGTPWNSSITSFGRALMLANTSGIYAMFGGSAEKVSSKLDGLFAGANLPLTGITNAPCGAVATIFGIRVFFLLIDAVDAFTNTLKPLMCAWDGNKWFLATQSFTPTFITTQEINSQLTAWGTDGTYIYPMFQQSSATLTKKFMGKLWQGAGWLVTKQELRVYAQSYNNAGTTYSINLQVDTELGSGIAYTLPSGGQVTWVNALNQVVTWTSSNGLVIWGINAGIQITGRDIDSVYGKLMGFTVSSTSPDFSIVSLALMHRNYQLYG